MAQATEGAAAQDVAAPAGTAEAAHARTRRRKARRRHIKFTREGRVFVLVTIGLGFAALNTGNNLMYLSMAFMLSLIVLSGILSELAIKDLRVTRRLPSRAFAGEPVLVELAVENQKERLPSYSIEVEDQVGDEPHSERGYLLKVDPGTSRSATYRRLVARRGELPLTRIRIGTRYPFSLFDKWRFQDAPETLLVYPRREPWDLEAEAHHRDGDQGGRATGRGAETRELRDYRDRDEVRRIHWRRSAALGRPIVREMEDEATHLVSLVVDNACPPADARVAARFESAIARAAYAAEAWVNRGAAVEIVARGERSVRVDAGGRVDPLWSFLARLQSIPTEGAPPLEASRPSAHRVHVEGSVEAS